jgi:hypothetical protein
MNEESTEVDSGEWSSRIIMFDTRRAWFQIGELIEPDYVINCWTMSICDEEGNWAVAIRLPASKTVEPLTGFACELVIISSGSADHNRGRFLDGRHSRKPLREMEPYEFYNVLCIGWYMDVTYRIAVERVEKYVWDE